MEKKLIFRKSIDYTTLNSTIYVPKECRDIFKKYSGELSMGETVEAHVYLGNSRVPVIIHREDTMDGTDKRMIQYKKDERIPLYIERSYPLSCAYIRAIKGALDNSKKHAKMPKHQDVQISIYGIGYRTFEFVCDDKELITREEVRALTALLSQGR